MFFDVQFSDGTIQTFQAHNKQQLKMALANVKFWKIVPRGQVLETIIVNECADEEAEGIEQELEKMDKLFSNLDVIQASYRKHFIETPKKGT